MPRWVPWKPKILGVRRKNRCAKGVVWMDAKLRVIAASSQHRRLHDAVLDPYHLLIWCFLYVAPFTHPTSPLGTYSPVDKGVGSSPVPSQCQHLQRTMLAHKVSMLWRNGLTPGFTFEIIPRPPHSRQLAGSLISHFSIYLGRPSAPLALGKNHHSACKRL